jgi:rubrerythrin
MPDNVAEEERVTDEQSSRSQFLKLAGGTGAASAVALFIAACGGNDNKSSSSSTTSTTKSSAKASTKGDLGILNYALTLEYLESTFYNEAIKSGQVKTKAYAEVAKTIAEDEMEHVQALTAAVKQLGGTPAPKPKTKFGPVIQGGEKKILVAAAQFENLGAAAYLGQAGNIKSKTVLAAALSIHSVEGRHAAVLNQVLGKSFVPDGAFAKPADMATVLKAVKPFIAS